MYMPFTFHDKIDKDDNTLGRYNLRLGWRLVTHYRGLIINYFLIKVFLRSIKRLSWCIRAWFVIEDIIKEIFIF